MAELTKERITEIRARCEAATPNWRICWHNSLYKTSFIEFGVALQGNDYWGAVQRWEKWDDLQFAIHARQDVPDLLDALEEAQAENERLQREVKRLRRERDVALGLEEHHE